MKRSILRTASFLLLALALPLKLQAAEDSKASLDIARLGLTTVGANDYYVPIPPSYPIEAAGQRVGPDNLWFKTYWVPKEQTMGTWKEMMSMLILPKNAPAIDVMAAQLSKSCPNSFLKRATEPPQFTITQPHATAWVMGCDGADASMMSLRGYYVSVQTDEHWYLLSREVRGTMATPDSLLQESTLAEWRQTFSKFAICEKGNFCVKLKGTQ